MDYYTAKKKAILDTTFMIEAKRPREEIIQMLLQKYGFGKRFLSRFEKGEL